MAAKRKAVSQSDDAPPIKRTTRSRRPLEETQAVVPALERSRRTRSQKALSEVTKEESNGNKVTRIASRRGSGTNEESKDRTATDKDHTIPPTRGKGGFPHTNHGSRAPSQASSSKVTLDALPLVAEADDSPDELLLSSPPHTRPSTPECSPPLAQDSSKDVTEAAMVSTPPRRTITAASLPRLTSGVAESIPTLLKRSTTVSVIGKPEFPRLPALPLPGAAGEDNELDILVAGSTNSPAKAPASIPFGSPRKGKGVATPQASPSRLPRTLPPHLHTSLRAQKCAVLRALHHLTNPSSTEDEEPEPSTNTVAQQQLCSLLKGTIERGEGNSCLLIGPRGSGKTQLLEATISALPENPIVIRLSGHVQHNDRLAVRELLRQLAEQTDRSMLPPDPDDDDDNPFIGPTETVISLPPPSHLLTLISSIPTLSRATVVILDAFDLFALHARQALLYCLLDTVQSCRAGAGNKGLAVVGVTTRVDTINMLEKRVKSRFSGRMLRTAPPQRLHDWTQSVMAALCTPITLGEDEDKYGDWSRMWEGSVTTFFDDLRVQQVLRDTFSLSHDLRLLSRLFIQPVANLTPQSPFLTIAALTESVSIQRCPPRFALLNALNYPSVCLLIAAIHARASGHEAVTFEMLFETFRDQLRTSLSAPVQVEGGGIGMMRCSRDILFRAFEILIAQRLFVAVSPPATGVSKGFVKYRCAVERSDVKRAVEKMGQLSLKKWFSKAQ